MIILGIDLGKARTGVAVCDRAEMLASPLCVIQERSKERLLERIAQLSEEQRAEQIALGLPKNMDGSEGESAQNAREFGALLQEKTGLPVSILYRAFPFCARSRIRPVPFQAAVSVC